MIKVISAISEKGLTCNEDSILFTDNFLAVIDGATGLSNIHFTNAETDAAWLSNRLCEILKYNLSNLNLTVSKILKDATKTIKAELDDIGYRQYEYAYPSASIAIIRINKDNLECFTLGDAPIIILKEDKTTNCIYDDTVTLRDNMIIDQMVEIKKQTSCTMLEAKEQVNNLLIENRLEKNQENAYYIFDPTGEGIDHMKTENIPIADIAAVSLMTDGYYAALSCFNIVKSQSEFMKLLTEGKSQQIMKSIRMLAFNDAELNRYPRLKIIDDASVIVAIKN